ncbi:MAG: dienelactone hydrolase family protein [Pseudolabrys sp.]
MLRASPYVLALALALTAGLARADETVTFDSARYVPSDMAQRLARERGETPKPSPVETITAYLAKPSGNGPFPAVVHLHGCGGLTDPALAAAATQITDWGFVAFIVDSFATRGVKNACGPFRIPDRQADALGALIYLSTLPYVDAKRVAVVGYSQGGIAALQIASLHDSVLFDMPSGLKYKAAVAFYPSCSAADDQTEIPVLVLIGELDDWSSPKECDWWLARRQDKSAPVKIVVYPGAFHSFDNPHFANGERYFGHWLKYDAAAAERASAEMHDFFAAQLAK